MKVTLWCTVEFCIILTSFWLQRLLKPYFPIFLHETNQLWSWWVPIKCRQRHAFAYFYVSISVVVYPVTVLQCRQRPCLLENQIPNTSSEMKGTSPQSTLFRPKNTFDASHWDVYSVLSNPYQNRLADSSYIRLKLRNGILRNESGNTNL